MTTDHTCHDEKCITCEIADQLETIIDACLLRMEAAVERFASGVQEGVFDVESN